MGVIYTSPPFKIQGKIRKFSCYFLFPHFLGSGGLEKGNESPYTSGRLGRNSMKCLVGWLGCGSPSVRTG